VVAAALLVVGTAGALLFLRSRPADSPAPPTPAEPPAAAPATPAPAEPSPAGSSPATPPAERAAAPAFVEEATCASCHPDEASAWQGTDHDLAMQPADAGSVLGDFDAVRFQDRSTDTRFLREGDAFVVETEGKDGERERFPVPYVFGWRPLQQVLLPQPRGRLQALSVAWDTRAGAWFSLYPDETIDARDPLHWTRPPHNWNFSCAECHATDLRRNYDAATDAYATSWHRLDVGCQACHGPAGAHVEWALEGDPREPIPGHGFGAPLGTAAQELRDSTREIETCARCHARRAPIGDGFDHRDRLLDDYLPSFLTTGLYHADGQILDEVYEYGSFLQSKMYAHGLRCSDCHDPHGLGTRRPGNTLCTACHSPTPQARPHVDLSTLTRKAYDSPEHHHHAPGTPGAQCVSCHMPQRTYMIVDPRRDHGFRVPRPDLAAETGAPDACTACHAERDPAWAAAEIARWSGPKERPEPFGVALQAGRTGKAGAAEALLALALSKEPPIVRGTALLELARYPSQAALTVYEAGTHDPDGLVRLAAVSGLELLTPAERVAVLGPMCADPLRGVRIEAARLLEGIPPEALGPHAGAVAAALDEYEAVQRALLERPEARLNLAQLLVARGQATEAERELRAAVRLDPHFVPAWVNLSDLARTTKSESEAEGVLRDGLRHSPDDPTLHHALGLVLVRQERAQDGLAELARAAELAPEDPRFGYVLAVALHDTGRPEEARDALRRVLAQHPGDRDARFALANYLFESGDEEGARRCIEELAAVNPYDPWLAGPGGGR